MLVLLKKKQKLKDIKFVTLNSLQVPVKLRRSIIACVVIEEEEEASHPGEETLFSHVPHKERKLDESH